MKIHKNSPALFLLILLAAAVMAFSIAGPELWAFYRDRSALGTVHTLASDGDGKGYRYTLSRGEKLFILSKALGSQALPESEQYAMTREDSVDPGNYAFVQNHRGPSGEEINDAEVYGTCAQGIADLKGLGILPDSVRGVDAEEYEAVLYSAIDVLEPRNNLDVWKISLSGSRKTGGSISGSLDGSTDGSRNMDRKNRLIDAYMDADDGKLYEFYARTELSWEDIDPDGIARSWSGYMGLGEPRPCEEENPLAEATPYFKKYGFAGEDGDETIVTIGFYEGINEVFLRVSR